MYGRDDVELAQYALEEGMGADGRGTCFLSLRTGNSNARVTTPPQSLQHQDAVVHPCLIVAVEGR